jgi:hypothetical protein
MRERDEPVLVLREEELRFPTPLGGNTMGTTGRVSFESGPRCACSLETASSRLSGMAVRSGSDWGSEQSRCAKDAHQADHLCPKSVRPFVIGLARKCSRPLFRGLRWRAAPASINSTPLSATE